MKTTASDPGMVRSRAMELSPAVGPGVLRNASQWPMTCLAVILMLVCACTRAPLETPPCAGHWRLNTSGLIQPTDHASRLRICVTTSGRNCGVSSMASIRSNEGFAPIPANDAQVLHDLTVQVMKGNKVLRGASLTRIALPRLARMSCHHVEIHYDPATDSLHGLFIR